MSMITAAMPKADTSIDALMRVWFESVKKPLPLLIKSRSSRSQLVGSVMFVSVLS